MFALNRANRNALVSIFVLLTIIMILAATKSNYSPRPITITPVNEESIFDLEQKLECTPGKAKEGSFYSSSKSPGGVCGAQKLVDEQAGYSISDGIGGSLI